MQADYLSDVEFRHYKKYYNATTSGSASIFKEEITDLIRWLKFVTFIKKKLNRYTKLKIVKLYILNVSLFRNKRLKKFPKTEKKKDLL